MKVELRTEEEMIQARTRMISLLAGGELDGTQTILIMGISVALQWACNDEQGTKTVSQLLSDAPV